MSVTRKKEQILPVIPLRNALMVPYIITPILVGRPASLEALEAAYLEDKLVLCISQKNFSMEDEDPRSKDLFRVGTLCNVLQIFRMPDGNVRALIEGKTRVTIKRFSRRKSFLSAVYEENELFIDESTLASEALMRSFFKEFQEYVSLSKVVPEESLLPFKSVEKQDEFFYFVLANIEVDLSIKQEVFEIELFGRAVLALFEILHNEIEILNLEKQIDVQVKDKLSKMQKDYYLNEQLKVIHKELGISDDGNSDLARFKGLLDEKPLNEEARKRAEEEIRKLARLTHNSPEYAVVYNYLTWIFDLPWENSDHEEINIRHAREILDLDHYGLEKVKERILEYLAVMQMKKKSLGQILCFVGPPGVGKTSLGKSIARALEREFVRLSLGGVRDEAEIRGHRRTYIGALPGVIIQSLKKAGKRNPLIMMDELDKMSVDFRGDPSAALLEVLDSEQNHQFRDHYLDFGYDLTDVLFITTANTLSPIPQPLRDRMEIIHIPGYTSIEKLNIAIKHLLPKQLELHETGDRIKLKFQKPAIQEIIDKYTREAGVRELERKLATVIRKIVRSYIEKPFTKPVTVKRKDLTGYLNVPKYLYSDVNQSDAVGVANGLAWTAHGGETLQIEVLRLSGDGKIKLTGSLGDVMKESAEAAFSIARYNASKYRIDKELYKKTDLHLHIPEGAIPKDGPSAGITIATAIISAMSDRKVRHDIAMTGEITLTGKVLPIGGLEEKLIAAKRAGITDVIIPAKNAPNVADFKKEVIDGMNIIYVDSIEEVLDIALKE
ncbi:MAG: endopeptidase La [Candidatus Cloacimonetes bacterium]|nr:endopeptidase La [Candidatus Cloacimonadota bacterium]